MVMKRICYLFLLFTLLYTSTTYAQNSGQRASKESPDNDQNELLHIEIRAFHDSVVKSLNVKRYSQQTSDSISAQEIGKFPDKNVAEALQRITGISLSRVQGEGERIGVRGTTPEQNRTYLNGQYLASADWWISSLPSRGFNFTLLPADIVSSLEVYKTPKANQDEGSLGGAINIKTLDPFFSDPGVLAITAQTQYNDLSQKYDPQLSAVYSWINADQNFATLFTINHHSRSLRRDGLESWGWHERSYFINDSGQLTSANNAQTTADLQNIWSPGGGGSAVFQQDRALTSFTTSTSYHINENWTLKGHLLHSQLNADNTNQNFLWQPGKALDAGSQINDYQIKDNTLVYGSLTPAQTQPFNTSMEAIWRKAEIQTQSIHLDLNYSGPWWRAQYQIGYTRGSGGTSEDNTAQFATNTQYSFDTRDAKNIQTDYQTSPLNGRQWFLSEARNDSQDGNDTGYFLQKDFSRDLSFKHLNTIRFGGKYKRHKRDFQRLRSQNGGLQGLAGRLNTTLSDYPAQFVSGYLDKVGNDNTLKAYSFADINALSRDFATLNFEQEEEKTSRFTIEEETLAGYAMIELAGDEYQANLGVRIVSTWQKAGAYERIATLPADVPSYNWQATSKNYTDILPSLNIQFDLSDQLISRFAVARVMSRAQFHHLMPSTNYNVTQAQGQGGNPNLNPYRATQYDFGLEWYFTDSALASIAIFNKDVESFIEFNRNIESHEGILMSIDRPINGAGGVIRGVELSYQQAIAYGFGVIANYTFVDGDRTSQLTGKTDWVPGTSRHSANLTAYYENSVLSLRLAYNYRTQFATGIGETKMDDYGQLDGSVTLSFSDNLDLVFEFLNLNDEQIYTYDRNEYAPTAIYQNGRRFYLGARYRFSTH
ncbi:TonB-dependent receptor [Pseudoalteromonas luteoviolacea]|uniref:TonB-dependent receptor n=2 Tax=Pseudoalteromonas luteoviolacea TaxID=43657 RepID=A0A0C1MH90_9GAMM|nr:TonB-dependent receptor [Pseudoalteromonas luteoviolacea]